ncbi:MAG: hypothetical protein R2692_03065 [Microbacterium sp.]
MSDIQLDLDVLRSARHVGDASATFESAGTVGGDVAPLTGEFRLRKESPRFRRQLGLQPGQAHHREARVPARRSRRDR